MNPLIPAVVTPALAQAVGSGGWNANTPVAESPAYRVVVIVFDVG